MRQSTLKVIVKLVTSLSVVVLVAIIIGLGVQYAKINNLESIEAKLQNELNELEQLYTSYEDEYTYIQTHYNEYVEDYVREKLGWGREGEIKFEAEE